MGSTHSTHEEEEDHQNKELEKEKDHPDNKKLEGNADFKGPSDPKNRHTTDCLCIILICMMWFSMTIVGFMVCGVIDSPDLPAGNPQKLMHMTDYEGNICGVDTKVEDKPYAYYLPSQDAVCVKKCPSKTDPTKFICEYNKQEKADENIIKAKKFVDQERCTVEVESVVGPFYICVFSEGTDDSADLLNSTLTGAPDQTSLDGFKADIMLTWHLILIFGFIVAMIMGFVSLRLLRIPCMLEIIIWGCIFGVFALLFGLGCMFYFVTASKWENEDPQTRSDSDIKAVKGLGTFFFVVCGLWTCIICCLRKRIMLGIGITKEAAKALGSMTSLILFPILQTIALLAFSCVWFVYLIYLLSSGELQNVTHTYGPITYNTTEYVYSDSANKAYWYLVFCWFWTSEFIMAFGQIVCAMAVAFWYFARDKSTIGSGTVMTAIMTTGRYHTGTAAFGSLIIAIIKTIRAFIAHLQKNAAKLSKRGGKVAATIASAILCCLQCCMWCIEKCAKFLNKHAYIQTAIFSYSFCKAARKAFFLILRNILLIGAVALVSEFVLTLLLILIPVSTTFLAYVFFSTMDELNSVVGITIFTFFLSYFTAKKFVETFGMVISTILQCYVADQELFEPEQRFAGGSLKSAISNGNSAAKKGGKGAVKVAPAPAASDETSEKAEEVK
jgi:choline transporter-like protein 2/4/5